MHPLALSGLRAQGAIYREMLPCAACGAVLTRLSYVWIHNHCTHLCLRRENWELGTLIDFHKNPLSSLTVRLCRPGGTCCLSSLPPPRTCRDRAGCCGPSTSAPSCTFWRRLWICVCQISQLNLVVAAWGGDSGAGCDEWLSIVVCCIYPNLQILHWKGEFYCSVSYILMIKIEINISRLPVFEIGNQSWPSLASSLNKVWVKFLRAGIVGVCAISLSLGTFTNSVLLGKTNTVVG